MKKSWLQSVESGVRFSDHHRDSARRYPAYHTADLNNAAPTSFIPYPSDFGVGLDGRSGWDNTGFTFTPVALKAYFATNTTATHRRIRAPYLLRAAHARCPSTPPT